YDGFRKVIAKEFNELYIIDTKGNARTTGERRRKEGGNIFSDEIRVGIAVYFLVRSEKAEGFKIYYNAIKDYANADEKKSYFNSQKFKDLDFAHVKPDDKYNWINLTDNDFDSLLPLANKDTKLAKTNADDKAIFKLFSNGIVTARDEWLYDFNFDNLIKKISHFFAIYQKIHHQLSQDLVISDELKEQIKLTSELEEYLRKGGKFQFDSLCIVSSLYRPFTKQYVYFYKKIIHRLYQMEQIFPLQKNNIAICLTCHKQVPFVAQVTNQVYDYGYGSRDTQCLPLYRYDKEGNRIDNITDWGLKQIQTHYQDETITKIDIFHYTYAVLHNPAYRTKYELN
ncbi:MAG: type ISP restriction/modification enzyme, partial [Dolichospermum sp.]